MYTFEIHFNQVKETTPLVCIQSVYVSNICIVAKNNKVGGFYFSKYITSKKGTFKHICGSVRYPHLNTESKVILEIKNFPTYPSLDNPYQDSLGAKGLEFLQHIILKDIKLCSSKK